MYSRKDRYQKNNYNDVSALLGEGSMEVIKKPIRPRYCKIVGRQVKDQKMFCINLVES